MRLEVCDMLTDNYNCRLGEAATELCLATSHGGEVSIVLENPEWRDVVTADWRRQLAAALDLCFADYNNNGDSNKSVTILLTDNARMQALNSQFRRLAQPTDVLAFTSADGKHLGDIAVGYEAVMAGTKISGMLFAHHAIHIIVHGVLHVLGFSHDDNQQASEMEAVESQIMSAIHLPDPYADANNNARAAAQTGKEARA